MKRTVGHPAVGLLALLVYTLMFVLIDGLNSSAESGGPSPGWLNAALDIIAGLCLPVIALSQRSGSLPGGWRIANTIAVIDATLLLLFSIGHWIDIFARPDGYWNPQFAPGSIGLLIVLGTALAQPGDPYRRLREGLIAAGVVASLGFVGLLITSRYSASGPTRFTPWMVIGPAMFAVLAGLIAYEFGSRVKGTRGSPADTPRP